VSSTGEELTGIAGWAVDLMEQLGAVGAGVGIAMENLFPPLPSELILPLAGFTASRGDMSLLAALVWTTIGSLVGALVLYGIGAAIGRDRVYWIWERMPLVKTSDLERTEAWFEKHGRKAVFFGRFIPIFRSLISIPAGVTRMPMLQFVVLTTVGSAIWNTIFVLAGYQLGEQWHRVEPVVGYLQKAVIVAVAVVVVVYLVIRVRQALRTRAAR